eukprot:jgi/Pico_ML_1/55641/g1301.t1
MADGKPPVAFGLKVQKRKLPVPAPMFAVEDESDDEAQEEPRTVGPTGDPAEQPSEPKAERSLNYYMEMEAKREEQRQKFKEAIEWEKVEEEKLRKKMDTRKKLLEPSKHHMEDFIPEDEKAKFLAKN